MYGPQAAGQRMARHCLFCGNRGGSREHVIPKWLSEVLEATIVEVRHRQAIDATGEVREFTTRNRAEYITKYVCRACNNGWMSSMEGAVKSLLTDMIRGQPYTVLPSTHA